MSDQKKRRCSRKENEETDRPMRGRILLRRIFEKLSLTPCSVRVTEAQAKRLVKRKLVRSNFTLLKLTWHGALLFHEKQND